MLKKSFVNIFRGTVILPVEGCYQATLKYQEFINEEDKQVKKDTGDLADTGNITCYLVEKKFHASLFCFVKHASFDTTDHSSAQDASELCDLVSYYAFKLLCTLEAE